MEKSYDPLYYADSLLTSFDATVVACDPGDGVFTVRLDRTAFYPTSGGQPFDTGRIGAAAVLDVLMDDDEVIRHVVDKPLAPGDTVRGEVDWARRFDHMQQHTGQHILSAAFDRHFGVRTVSFHMGVDVSTIDLAREVSAAEIGKAEAESNRIVWEDRQVTVRFASDEEAAAMPLRKESKRTGRLRLVNVTDFDLSACGGTHVPSTGRIGIIAVAGWERFKGGSRVSFVCGGRALRAYGELRDTVTAATRALSIAPAELGATVARLQEEQKNQARAIRRLQEASAATQAAALVDAAQDIDGVRYVLCEQPGWDGAALKTLAAAIVTEPGRVAILAGEGQPAPVIVARSADLKFDAGAWLKGAMSALGGRGGGRPEIAQGGIPATADAILAYARKTIG